MQPLKSREDFFRDAQFEEKVGLARDAGARLTPLQVEFLREAIYQGMRSAFGRQPKPMSPRQRNLKKTYVDGLRSSVADLEAHFNIVRTIYQVPAWLTPKDVQRAMSKEQLGNIVGHLTSMLGREYADRVLMELAQFYAGTGERIQVVRDAV